MHLTQGEGGDILTINEKGERLTGETESTELDEIGKEKDRDKDKERDDNCKDIMERAGMPRWEEELGRWRGGDCSGEGIAWRREDEGEVRRNKWG